MQMNQKLWCWDSAIWAFWFVVVVFFFGHAAACRILVPGPGIKGTHAPCSGSVESYHWITREAPIWTLTTSHLWWFRYPCSLSPLPLLSSEIPHPRTLPPDSLSACAGLSKEDRCQSSRRGSGVVLLTQTQDLMPSCAIPAALLAILTGLKLCLKLRARWLRPVLGTLSLTSSTSPTPKGRYSCYHFFLKWADSPELGGSSRHHLGTPIVTPCPQILPWSWKWEPWPSLQLGLLALPHTSPAPCPLSLFPEFVPFLSTCCGEHRMAHSPAYARSLSTTT